jgi:GrpB-like predicted nucleotidyltransferase (UPF0157 family)
MVKIIPYQPAWPHEFREIAASLRARLGELATRIDHIGSTAVHGLAAKDVIDIQIIVLSFNEELQKSLESIGYSRVNTITKDHRPAGDSSPAGEWDKWFFQAPPNQRATNTHVRIAGRANQRYALMFRDYLRSHPFTAAAYSQLKKSLAQELRDVDRYPEVKDAAVDLIYLAADEWASATDWHIGPSDA